MANKPTGSRHGRDRHLDDCFGRGDAGARRDCPCSEACRRLCAEVHLEDWNGPRVHRRQGKFRPYTPIPNVILRSWAPALPDPNPAVKLCYAGLISYAQGSRWITDRTAEVAKALGFKPKRFHEYCAELEEGYNLIQRVPLREVSTHHFSNHYAILLLDLPAEFPGHLDEDRVTELRRRYEPESAGYDDDLEDIEEGDVDLYEIEEDETDFGEFDLDDDEEVIVAPRSKGFKNKAAL